MHAWIETIFKPSGKLKDAVTYAVNQKEFLCTFLYHGEVEACNNQVENAQRGVVVGRKNWLFCDTPKGAEASVIAYSILETAKANGLNPEKYLMHLRYIDGRNNEQPPPKKRLQGSTGAHAQIPAAVARFIFSDKLSHKYHGDIRPS